MNYAEEDSVVLIKSNNSNNQKFGTGFIIHQDKINSYVLTCDHVVKDVGGNEKVAINEANVKQVFSGSEYGIDLSVLRIEGLLDKSPLKLNACGEKGNDVLILGFQPFNKVFLFRPLNGKLGNQIGIIENDRKTFIKGWDLIFDDYELQPGYSGSPVFDKKNNSINGVVSHRIGEGGKGIAISIEMIKKVWTEMPHDLLFVDNQSGTGDKMTSEKTGAVKQDIAVQIEKIEKLFVNAEYKQAYEIFFKISKSYPEFIKSATSIYSRYNDLCKELENGSYMFTEKNHLKQQIANSFQECLNRFKNEQSIR